MSEETPADTRKRLRVGRASERGAVNAVRTLFEEHGLVVDEPDGRNDYGRDLIVDITEDDAITGGVIGVQVKGDKRFIGPDDWTLPATDKDLTYWSESTVPVIGILWDPASRQMRWANLSAHARTDDRLSTWPGYGRGPHFDRHTVRFPHEQVLDAATVADLVDRMQTYLRQSTSQSLVALFGTDAEKQRRAIFDCWSLGRNDARAFVLLRRALLGLTGAALVDAIVALSHLTPHPDIFWSARNWIPREVEEVVVATFRWSAEELVHLVGELERFEDGPGWERGGIGQCLWCLLIEDARLAAQSERAISVALAAGEMDTAFRLLVIHQSVADDPVGATRAALANHPQLIEHHMTRWFVDELERAGWISVY